MSYRPWAERVIDLCEGEHITPPAKEELQLMYNNNFYYEDAVLFARFKCIQHVWMELHVRDEKGIHIERFNNTEQAKEFFNKFPKLREYLQKG